MPKCPECKECIESIVFDVVAGCRSEFNLNDKTLDYDIDALTEGVEFKTFACPECDSFLFRDEQDAREFLKNEYGN